MQSGAAIAINYLATDGTNLKVQTCLVWSRGLLKFIYKPNPSLQLLSYFGFVLLEDKCHSYKSLIPQIPLKLPDQNVE